MWADISNFAGALTSGKIAALKGAGYVGVIVQAITGNDGVSYTRQQLQAAQDNGLRIAGYVWCFHNSSVAGRLQMFNGFDIESLWLDVETLDLQPIDVTRDLGLCDSYAAGKYRTGIYTGRWVWVALQWGAFWPDRPLWASIYDNNPDKSVGFIPFGGWTSCTMKQYIDSAPIGGADSNIT